MSLRVFPLAGLILASYSIYLNYTDRRQRGTAGSRFGGMLLAGGGIAVAVAVVCIAIIGFTSTPTPAGDISSTPAPVVIVTGDATPEPAPVRSLATADAGALGVNPYLWRAALDVLGFMPLESADGFGGVIITGWYETGGERFKAVAYILGHEMRDDAVRVTLFRQIRDNAEWKDAPVQSATVEEIEAKVISRAHASAMAGKEATDANAHKYEVYFAANSTELNDRGIETIREAAALAKSAAYTRIEVNGYTDTSGTPQAAKSLSTRTANTVAAELEKNGIPAGTILIQSFGDSDLEVPTGPGVAEPENRRVEIVIR
jgi:outer membrane protein OmpA-like peptidoglycan-associated protein